jgi:hypothetical protein
VGDVAAVEVQPAAGGLGAVLQHEAAAADHLGRWVSGDDIRLQLVALAHLEDVTQRGAGQIRGDINGVAGAVLADHVHRSRDHVHDLEATGGRDAGRERHESTHDGLLSVRALSIRTTRQVDPVALAQTRFALARALWTAPVAQGRDRPRARTLAEQARDAYTALGDAEKTSLAEVQAWLAEHRLP